MIDPARKGSSSRTRALPRLLLIYTATTAFGVAAFAIRQVLSLAVGPGLPPYITFYPAVMLAALMAGLGPGLLETAITAFIAIDWILSVQGHFTLARPADALGLAIFLSMGVFMSVVAELYRRARQKAAVSQHLLELRESETRFSAVFRASPIGVSITRRADGKYVDVNPSFLSLFGYTREEVVGRTSLELQTWARPEERDHLTRTLDDHGSVRSMETGYRHKSGEALTALVSAEDIDVSGERCILMLMQDITDRKRAETSLRESQEHYRSLFTNMLNGFAFCRMLYENGRPHDFIYTEVNDAFTALTGLKDVTGRKVSEVIPGIRESDPQLLEVYGRVAQTGTPERFESYVKALEMWFSISVYCPRRGYFVAVFDVITERKRSEQELEQRVQNRTAELKAANEELEAFSYSVSHDLRGPLRHISGFLDLLQRSAGEALDQKAERYLGIIKDSARQMGVLIDDLLTLSKIGRASFTAGPVPLEPLVTEVISDLSHAAAGRDVKWIMKDLPQVQGDRNLLKLVLANLLDNALKYTRTRETAVIELRSENRDGAVVIHVRDNGVGFDPRGAEKLFGVFQRLHSASEFEGTGIGLANVRRIITRHGGKAWAESELGTGSTFSFSLPEKGIAAT